MLASKLSARPLSRGAVLPEDPPRIGYPSRKTARRRSCLQTAHAVRPFLSHWVGEVTCCYMLVLGCLSEPSGLHVFQSRHDSRPGAPIESISLRMFCKLDIEFGWKFCNVIKTVFRLPIFVFGLHGPELWIAWESPKVATCICTNTSHWSVALSIFEPLTVSSCTYHNTCNIMCWDPGFMSSIPHHRQCLITGSQSNMLQALH